MTENDAGAGTAAAVGRSAHDRVETIILGGAAAAFGAALFVMSAAADREAIRPRANANRSESDGSVSADRSGVPGRAAVP